MADCTYAAYRNVYMRHARGPHGKHYLNCRKKPATTQARARRGDASAQRKLDIRNGRYSWDGRGLDYREYKPAPKKRPAYKVREDGTIESEFAQLRKQPVLLPREKEQRAARQRRARRQRGQADHAHVR